jgi:hypothetical protein
MKQVRETENNLLRAQKAGRVMVFRCGCNVIEYIRNGNYAYNNIVCLAPGHIALPVDWRTP